MTEECIHGLDVNRCDICTPQEQPAPKATTGTQRSSRAASTARRSPAQRSTARAARSAASKPLILGEQRIHHLTHIDNLTGILVDGAIHADADPAWTGRPEIDISSSDTRLARRGATIPGSDRAIADYVPFFLSPDATIWEGLLDGTPDPRLSDRSRSLPSSEFIMLVTTVRHVSTEESYPVVSDGDAAVSGTTIAATRDGAEQLLRRLITGDDGAVLRAEVLVHAAVTFRQIQLIGVAHEKARSAVRSLLAGSGFQPRVAVHPPWFAPATRA